MACLKPALSIQSKAIVGSIAERLGLRPLPVEKLPASKLILKGFGERSSECEMSPESTGKIIPIMPVKSSPEKTDHIDAFSSLAHSADSRPFVLNYREQQVITVAQPPKFDLSGTVKTEQAAATKSDISRLGMIVLDPIEL